MPVRIGEEVSEEIDFVPAKRIRRTNVRPKYACRCGEAGVAIAPLPPRLIPQSRLGLGLAVHVVLARYDDHLSFYRLEQQFRERHGIVIVCQQMVQWAEHIANWLRPVYDAMWQAMLAVRYLQIDETPVKVLDPDVKGKAARGYLWFYAVPGGDVILEFDPSRGMAPVRKRLAGFTGTIQTDAYEVYQSLERKETHIQCIACLAHARRYFVKAVKENLPPAVWLITQIRSLYRIEKESRDLPPDERRDRRLEEAPAIWEKMKATADELKPSLLPKSTLGKAVNYFINEYEALKGYLRDERFEIDNNLIENSIRPTAVGRRRWLFIGHPDAGWRSAVIYSILVSLRRRGINPQEYLTDVLARLPAAKTSDIPSLLPANWKSHSTNTS
jgi:transposase